MKTTESFAFPDLAMWNDRRRRSVLSWWNEDALEAPEGWSVGRANPELVLACFPELKLRTGIKLWGYQFKDGDSGNGLVRAFPIGTDPWASLPPDLGPQLTAPASIMPAIQGDGTPQSYLAASVCFRECREIGAFGHGIDWLDRHLLSNDLWDKPLTPAVGYNHEPLLLEKRFWHWHAESPTQFAPSVEISPHGPGPVVTFYTYHGRNEPVIIRHEDTFASNDYSFRSKAETIALPIGGR